MSRTNRTGGMFAGIGKLNEQMGAQGTNPFAGRSQSYYGQFELRLSGDKSKHSRVVHEVLLLPTMQFRMRVPRLYNVPGWAYEQAKEVSVDLPVIAQPWQGVQDENYDQTGNPGCRDGDCFLSRPVDLAALPKIKVESTGQTLDEFFNPNSFGFGTRQLVWVNRRIETDLRGRTKVEVVQQLMWLDVKKTVYDGLSGLIVQSGEELWDAESLCPNFMVNIIHSPAQAGAAQYSVAFADFEIGKTGERTTKPHPYYSMPFEEIWEKVTAGIGTLEEDLQDAMDEMLAHRLNPQSAARAVAAPRSKGASPEDNSKAARRPARTARADEDEEEETPVEAQSALDDDEDEYEDPRPARGRGRR